jgi:2-deoxy-D-gluconate 3-dehydrogenase
MALTIDLSGRAAIVTGAGKGIGRAICLTLAEAGAAVVAVSRTEADLDSLGGEVRAAGGRYYPVVAELGGEIVAGRVAQTAVAAFDAIDILVNNAGVALNAPAEAVTEEDWDATMATNLRGAFFMAQAAGRHMLARGQGRIINVTSQSGVVALHNHAAYCASKAGLGMLTKVLALEWGPRGVTVNAVAPTVILTPMGERVWGDPVRGGPMLAKIPVGRFGVPADVAGVVAFLASDHAALINGETVVVDGGYTAH